MNFTGLDWAVVAGLLVRNLIRVRSDAFWLTYFQYKFYVDVSLGLITSVWFAVGGWRDMRDLFRHLRTLVRDDRDDGRVEAPPAKASGFDGHR